MFVIVVRTLQEFSISNCFPQSLSWVFLTLSLIYRWTLASSYQSPGLYLGSAERATRFTETPTQSSEFVTQQHQVFVESEECTCAFILICVKVDGKGGGGPLAHTRHFLDLWHPCSQHTLFGVPVYFCYIQLITSRSSCAGKVACKIKRVSNQTFCFPFSGILCLLVSLPPKLWGIPLKSAFIFG